MVDEWQSPLPVIEKAVPELRVFIQALDFCNSVLQVYHMGTSVGVRLGASRLAAMGGG